MKTYLLSFFALLIASTAFSQTNKKVDKAWAKFDSGDQEKGIEMMRRIIKSDNTSENWDNLCEMEVTHYSDEPSMENSLDAVLAQALKQVDTTLSFTVVTHKDVLYNQMINTCREASLQSESLYASIYLRSFLIDNSPDSVINYDAEKALNEGENYFVKGDYKSAIAKYRKALSLQPGYYKATLFIGDGYYGLQRYDSAIHYFEKCVLMNPNSLEPRKYLVDALARDEQYDRAANECITGLCFYPEPSMFLKLSDLYEVNGKKLNRHWFPRDVYINGCGSEPAEGLDDPWSKYKAAASEVQNYCKKGILSENPVTGQKYLEVYCWEKMLNDYNGTDPNLLFAKKVQSEGYLDCYVLFSLFHIDLYDQYIDFTAGNRERLLYYINHYLVE